MAQLRRGHLTHISRMWIITMKHYLNDVDNYNETLDYLNDVDNYTFKNMIALDTELDKRDTYLRVT